MKRWIRVRLCLLATVGLLVTVVGCGDQGGGGGAAQNVPAQSGPPEDVKQQEKDMMNVKPQGVKDPNKP